MTEPTHTPGPWIAREQRTSGGDSLGWIIEYAGGRIGWSSYATAEPNEGEGPPYAVGGANARLIAAAPDLLLSLRNVLALAPDVDDADHFREALEGARTAIAKATAEKG